MRILVIGGGGREHALGWSMAKSPRRPELIFAPGNPGTAALGRNVELRVDDVPGIVALARAENVDLVVVGPELPLVLGLADRLEEAGIPVMGPKADAARLEGSKAFAKAFMERNGVPTAAYRAFRSDEFEAARAFVESEGAPIVVKASGLAGGKGAIVCSTVREAVRALSGIMQDQTFGEAGSHVVVESFMDGEEASIFALCDGEHYVLLSPAQDHKRVGENDTGPNTGGMGAYAPAPLVDDALLAEICERIIDPTLRGMREEGYPYKGVLYVGVMVTNTGPRVVEFNCRFGDPEAQVVLPLLESDLVDVFEHLTAGTLDQVQIRYREGAAACVVLASPGYPGPYTRGAVIEGVETASAMEKVAVFLAGTSQDADGILRTSGGRVLAVSAVGSDLRRALSRVYAAVAQVTFEGCQYRRDIGRKGLVRLSR